MSISNSTQPSEYKSACGPAGRPDACSGDRYAAVPSTPAVPVTPAAPSARAMPKSSTLTCPPASTMFAGVMSRCTSPAACATSSASHTAAAMRTASPAASIPASSRTCRRVRPATSSITMNGVRPVDTGVEHRHQPRVTEPGRVPGLPVKPGQETRIGRVLRAEHLDRDLAAQHLIPGPPHRGHAAGTQHLAQHVPAAKDPGAGHRHDSAPGQLPARPASDRARARELAGPGTAANSALPSAPATAAATSLIARNIQKAPRRGSMFRTAHRPAARPW